MDQWKHVGTLDNQAANLFKIVHYTIFSLERSSPLFMSKWVLIGLIVFIFYNIINDHCYPLMSTPSKAPRQTSELSLINFCWDSFPSLSTKLYVPAHETPCQGWGAVRREQYMHSVVFSLLSITNPPHCKAKTASQQGTLTEAPVMCAM